MGVPGASKSTNEGQSPKGRTRLIQSPTDSFDFLSRYQQEEEVLAPPTEENGGEEEDKDEGMTWRDESVRRRERPVEQLAKRNSFAGDFGFKVSFKEEGNVKSLQDGDGAQHLFTIAGFPISIRIEHSAPSDTPIRFLVVFTDPSHSATPIRLCRTHKEQQLEHAECRVSRFGFFFSLLRINSFGLCSFVFLFFLGCISSTFPFPPLPLLSLLSPSPLSLASSLSSLRLLSPSRPRSSLSSLAIPRGFYTDTFKGLLRACVAGRRSFPLSVTANPGRARRDKSKMERRNEDGRNKNKTCCNMSKQEPRSLGAEEKAVASAWRSVLHEARQSALLHVVNHYFRRFHAQEYEAVVREFRSLVDRKFKLQ
ncbi:hypothetical protein C7M84_002676 [Penaeus vannamei]|uniref:Uncharacterized protein n=1 Tax=Penaeus vannamei TaxID=6689 RepID=A0A423TQA4_PENVA|nr:hypothetical protein C7M84_002676 [Penaeus vannamei]